MSHWAELFGDQLTTKTGSASTADVCNGKKAIGIYFSAHWCPPCRAFTPVLAEFYLNAQEADDSGIEIIFVSSDQDQQSFDEYYGTMPWTAVPFGSAKIRDLGSKFSVRGIPSLIILDPSGNVKDANGRGTVQSARGDVSKALGAWA